MIPLVGCGLPEVNEVKITRHGDEDVLRRIRADIFFARICATSHTLWHRTAGLIRIWEGVERTKQTDFPGLMSTLCLGLEGICSDRERVGVG